MPEIDTSRLVVVNHSLVQHKLTLMRSIETPAPLFRQLLREPRYESEKVVEGSAWIEPASASTEESAEEAESE